MKIFSPLICITLAFMGILASKARSQDVYQPGANISQQGQSSFVPFHAYIPTIMPGRFWVGTRLAESGVGYSGPYTTLGGKARLGEDHFDGRWVGEAQGHISLETGGLFGNIGVERIITIDAAESDVMFGLWYDHDADIPDDFGHSFHRIAMSLGVKKASHDIYGNGYLPIGTTDHLVGDPDNQYPFAYHGLIIQPGIDSALRGFDFQVRSRPDILSFANGYVEAGFYGFESDLVDQFYGGRIRTGMQALRGGRIDVELNLDERFDFTGFVNFSWVFGAGGAGSESFGQGRDLERTVREDHINKFHQEPLLAYNPKTSAPYNVYHVDNTAPDGGNGTFEAPFNSLAAAEAGSIPDSIVFVHRGDGTTTGMSTGFVMQPGQYLLGQGVVQTVPLGTGGSYTFRPGPLGLTPTVTGTGGAAITMNTCNTIRGFTIDRDASPSMTHGIVGIGTALAPLEPGVIENVTITGQGPGPLPNPQSGSSGIFLDHITGTWTFNSLIVEENPGYGLFIGNMYGATSGLLVGSSSFNTNGLDGFHVGDDGITPPFIPESYDGSIFTFSNVTTNSNGRNGLHMANYANGGGVGATWTFTDHVAQFNNESGLYLDRADGDVVISDVNISNNVGNGIYLRDVKNTLPSQNTIIAPSTVPTLDPTTGLLVSTNIIQNNGFTTNGGQTNPADQNSAAAGIKNILNAGTQRLIITGNDLDRNGVGIYARANNAGTTLATTVQNNVDIANYTAADLGRFVVAGGARHDVLIENESTFDDGIWDLNNVGSNAGVGFTFHIMDGGANTSRMTTVLRNVTMNNPGSGFIAGGIYAIADGNAQFNFFTDNLTINNPSNDAISINYSGITNTLRNTVVVTNTAVNEMPFLTAFTTGTLSPPIGLYALGLNASGSAQYDFYVDNFRAINTVPAAGPNQGGSGLQAIATGTSLMRLDVRNSVFVGHEYDGVHVEAQNASRVLATFTGNTSTDNGTGDGNTAAPPIPSPAPNNWPFLNGYYFGARNSGILNLTFLHNTATRNGEAGLHLQTQTTLATDTATINAYIADNNLHGNDIYDDATTPPPVSEANDFGEFLITNGPWAPASLGIPAAPASVLTNIRAELTNNYFQRGWSTDPNGGGPISVQLDGTTVLDPYRGFGATFVGGPFGTLATPPINAANAFFTGAGFPVLPPTLP